MHISAPDQFDSHSHLSAYFTGHSLSFLYTVLDYNSSNYCADKFAIPVPRDFTIDQLDKLIGDSLKIWGDELDSEFLDCDSGVCLLGREAGGIIDSTSLILSSEFKKTDVRSDVLGTKAVTFDTKKALRGGVDLERAIDATALIVVSLNWDEICVLCFTPQKKNEPNEGIHVRELHVDGAIKSGDSSFKKVCEGIRRLQSTEISRVSLVNMMANVFGKKPLSAHSTDLWDALRSYITLSLFSLQDSVFRKFGIDFDSSHLLITGDLVSFIPESHVVLSVVDGLQLRGRYNIAVDKDSLFAHLSVLLDSRAFPVPVAGIYPKGYMYLSTEKGGSGKAGRRSFRGILFEDEYDSSKNLDIDIVSGEKDTVLNSTGKELILGQVGGIYVYDVDKYTSVALEPERSVYFPNLKRDGKYLKHTWGDKVSNLIIDCRQIPAVYGPDASSNKGRISSWMSSLSMLDIER